MIRAIALLLLLAGCAQLGQAECFAPKWEASSFIEKTLDANKGLIYAELTDKERTTYLQNINTMHPETGIMYERVGFFEHGNSAIVLVLHIERGCVWDAGPMRRIAFYWASQRGGT